LGGKKYDGADPRISSGDFPRDGDDRGVPLVAGADFAPAELAENSAGR
jgi:hypothetical protein